MIGRLDALKLKPAKIEVISQPSPIPDRVNEDAWLVLETWQPPGFLIAAVIDGAGTRLTLPALAAALKQRYHGLTPAAFAAMHVRVSLTSQFTVQPDRSLRAALLAANEQLQAVVADLIGGFSYEHIQSLAGIPVSDDPRRIRLVLPACVVTLIRLNYAEQQLEYVHAGDTSLWEIKRNGEAIRHTSDQMGSYDQAALRLAASLRDSRGLPHLSDAIELPEVRDLSTENGLRHNYVDEQGHTKPGEGCGIVNGLPELADYLEQQTLAVDPEQTEGFCLLSDGLQVLAPLTESLAEREVRLGRMVNLLRSQGLSGLFEVVKRMAESDPHLDVYPRMKFRDDATGVFVQISEHA